jgi:hypothetical protein
MIWCFSDRASQYKLVFVTNLMHSSFIHILQNKGTVHQVGNKNKFEQMMSHDLVDPTRGR